MNSEATGSRQPLTQRFVVVEGPIGVGKTALARRIAAATGAELVLEQADENPFLERFYRDPRTGALPAQLYFLFQRARQLQALRQADLFAPHRVGDYLLAKDRLFARVTLDDEEFALYEQVYASFQHDESAPAALWAMGYRNVMFGSDYPHLEGTFGHTQETLHGLFDDVAPEVRHRITRGAFEELFPHVSAPPATVTATT